MLGDLGSHFSVIMIVFATFSPLLRPYLLYAPISCRCTTWVITTWLQKGRLFSCKFPATTAKPTLQLSDHFNNYYGNRYDVEGEDEIEPNIRLKKRCLPSNLCWKMLLWSGFVMAYLLFGGLIFTLAERPNELNRIDTAQTAANTNRDFAHLALIRIISVTVAIWQALSLSFMILHTSLSKKSMRCQ